MAKKSFPAWLLALGAGLGTYFIFRGGSADALPPIPTAVTPPATPSNPTPTATVHTSNGSMTPAQVARLMAPGAAGMLARQVFYVQATMFTYGVSADFPDGVLGPNTWDNINTLRASARLPQNVEWNVDTISQVIEAIKRARGGLNRPRLLPYAMPRSIVDQINAEVVPLAGRGAPLLQAQGV